MIVKILSNGELVTSGYIRFENEKVNLQFMDTENEILFRGIGLGARSFKPSDGLEYMNAVVTAFMRSTAIVLVEEEQDKEWRSVKLLPKMKNYKVDINDRYWEYQKSQFSTGQSFFERPYVQDGRPPVFIRHEAWRNVIINPFASQQETHRLLALIPKEERHRWFGSMNSSQALAQSIFGNLAIHGSLECLSEMKDDEGIDLFGKAQISSDNFKMEKKIDYLGEPRQTSLDGYISGDYQIAIECKFTEAEVGSCSRPQLTAKDSNYESDYCDGTYSVQKKRKMRCSLAERKILYWRYAPQLLKWTIDSDLNPCPMKKNYQLIRNVLAAGVKPDGTVSVNNGHALLIYDERNPAFQQGGKGMIAYTETRTALQETTMLRKCSWQRIVQRIRENNILSWLSESLALKYGM
jgi:hypothetical protein